MAKRTRKIAKIIEAQAQPPSASSAISQLRAALKVGQAQKERLEGLCARLTEETEALRRARERWEDEDAATQPALRIVRVPG